MRVFVTGASGAIGRPLVTQLIDAGHEVVGTHHSPASAELLQTLGAKPVLLDLFDERAVEQAMREHEPEAIVHEATALAEVKFGRNLDKILAKTNQLRTWGTDALLAAAREAGVSDSSPRVAPSTGVMPPGAGRSRPRTIRLTRSRRPRLARRPPR